MKIILTALNSKYMHTSLAIRSLQSYLRSKDMKSDIGEYTINDSMEYVCEKLIAKNGDVYCFSTYIWNYEKTLELCERIKIIKPNTIIILGGPEVSFTQKEILQKYNFVDFVISGEGEKPLYLLLNALKNKENSHDIPQLAYRQNGEIIINDNKSCGVLLDDIPFAYSKRDLLDNGHKLIYYESSRGCPYHCAYCISSALEPVKFLSLNRVYSDLKKLFNQKVYTIKFVDRTFNADRKRAIQIIHFCNENSLGTKVHFEIYPDLIDEAFLKCCKSLKKDIFQFEIGIQTINNQTLREVGRKNNLISFDHLKKLLSFHNIEVHMDLIAMLPYETFSSFKKSFNRVYDLSPNVFQLGFLKLLKGTKMRQNAGEYGFKYLDKPPYEVVESSTISYFNARKIKYAEYAVDKFYNSGKFKHSLSYILKFYNAFDFYCNLGSYIEKQFTLFVNFDENTLSEILFNYVQKSVKKQLDLNLLEELLKLDYFSQFGNKKRLSYLSYQLDDDFADESLAFLENPEKIKKYIPHYAGEHPKSIMKSVHFGKFMLDQERVFLIELKSKKMQEIK